MCGPKIPSRISLAVVAWLGVLAATLPFQGHPDPVPPPTYHLTAQLSEKDAQAAQVAEFLRAQRFPCDAPTCASDTDVIRIARVVVEESGRVQADPMVTASIMTVENPWLDTAAVSSAGAVGLMQVMEDVWSGEFGAECGTGLTRVRAGVCYGVRVAARYGVYGEDPSAALLSYNGCHRPGCAWYAVTVLARADQ